MIQMPTLSQIEISGSELLEQTIQPIPRWRIVRDVLCLPVDDPRYIQAHTGISSSKWVSELRQTQHPDGNWGRFHSRDSALKQRFPTTELAIRRALSLGLDSEDVLLRKTQAYLRMVLDGKATWSDPPEKHEGWPINIRFITAAVLTLLDSADPQIAPLAQAWSEVTAATFAGGNYSPEAEQKAHLRINNIHTRGKYLKLAGLYPLLLLASPSAHLPETMEKALLDWVWSKPDGIYYVYGGRVSDPPAPGSAHFIDWLAAIRLLLRFKYGRSLCAPVLDWLWRERNAERLWDFGPAACDGFTLPLSENWRAVCDRKVDCSVLALALFRESLLTEKLQNNQA
jgi:hypothetical protein